MHVKEKVKHTKLMEMLYIIIKIISGDGDYIKFNLGYK